MGSDALELSTPGVLPTPVPSKDFYLCLIPHYLRMNGEEKGGSGYLFHLEKFERCLHIGGELSNSPINIHTRAKVLFFPLLLNSGLKGTLLLVGIKN